MARFIYTAKSQPNKATQGHIEAESEQDAINKLTRMGYFPISVKYETPSLERRGIIAFRRIPHRDIVLFTRHLSILIESGVNILNALNIISKQATNKYLEAALSDIASSIKDGKSLSDSLSAFPNLFSNLYCAMIGTGEASGDLDSTLKRLADFLEKEEEFKQSLRASLTYPLFVFIISALTVVVLLVFVIPKLLTMFEDKGQILPLPTRILISTSNFLRNYWWLIIAVIGILIFLARRIHRSAKGKITWDRLKLKLFLFGPLILKTEISRLMRTLSLLLSSGLPITPALDTSVSILENQILKMDTVKIKEEISKGLSLSHSLKNSRLFPDFVTNIVLIGEETGALDRALMRIAQDYEREVDQTLKTFTRLLEPVIILVMGLVVGFIVLSMLLPIFQINLIAR